MDPYIRPVAHDEFAEFIQMLETGAGRHAGVDARADAEGAYQLARTLAVVDGGRLVAGTASDVLELTVPGLAQVRAVRPTLTAVLPTHRGRGFAGMMLARQLRDLQKAGEKLVIATTSTPGLVARLGYGPADVAVEIEAEPGQLRLPDLPDDHVVRLVSPEESRLVLPEIFDRHRRAQPGQVSRSAAFWKMWFCDRELYRIGSGERFVVVCEHSDGASRGYATYRLVPGDLRDQPVDTLFVEDLIAVTESARRALWRYCLLFTQARAVRAYNTPADEPLRWMMHDTRGLSTRRVRDFLWLRLVDVADALTARRYAAPGELMLDVRDGLLEENTGTYALVCGTGGSALCTRAVGRAQLSVDVAALASVYLGGFTFTSLARAGRVVEQAPGASAAADAMFGCHPGPWTVTDW